MVISQPRRGEDDCTLDRYSVGSVGPRAAALGGSGRLVSEIVCGMLLALVAGLWCCVQNFASDSDVNPWHEQRERNRKRRYW